MPDFEALIGKGKYREAAKLLDAELAKKESDRLYYLRAIVSFRLKNYEYAHEMLEHALYMKKDPDYLKLKALILMETLEFAEALEMLKGVLDQRKDAESYFLSSMCLMFLDDPKSREYLQLAYLADPGKTKALIREFYGQFFRNNRYVSEKEKKALEARIAAIK
ncbi:Tetratricopeptide repeat protein [uncultured archaeon]|nr:Tetratricopeptide repeat protein [uncultured archaeon]